MTTRRARTAAPSHSILASQYVLVYGLTSTATKLAAAGAPPAAITAAIRFLAAVALVEVARVGGVLRP